jgi:hypothetical protein
VCIELTYSLHRKLKEKKEAKKKLHKELRASKPSISRQLERLTDEVERLRGELFLHTLKTPNGMNASFIFDRESGKFIR